MERCCATTPVTGLDLLKAAWKSGDHLGALRIAVGFRELGHDRDRIQRAWSSYQRPDFYRDLGDDPAELLEDGFRALAERYSL